MALFENFPYSNLHELNLDWLIDVLNNIKDGQVTSVNGETGDVILYENAEAVLPEITGAQWSIVRNAAGIKCGIAFDNNGTAYIVNNNTLSQIYDNNHQPPYPVTSVNGMTGDITLYNTQYVQLPSLTDAQMSSWTLFRQLNSVNTGIEFKDDGTACIIFGATRDRLFTENHPQYENEIEIRFPNYNDNTQHCYWIGRYFNGNYLALVLYDDGNVSIMTDDETEIPLYVQGVNEPSDFTDPANTILEIKNNLDSGTQWGIIRNCSGVDVGIVFVFNSNTLEWDGYIKKDNTLTKLLTAADIPSSSGVVSINNKTGAVTLYGNEIPLSAYNPETVTGVLTALRNTDDCINAGISTLITSNTHDAIRSGQYLYVKNNPVLLEGLYTATADIAANATIDQSNTTPASKVLNKIPYSSDAKSYTQFEHYCFGYVTNNALDLYICVPLIVENNVTSINITSMTISLRSPAGGFVSQDGVTVTGNIHAAVLRRIQGLLIVQLRKSTAWSNAINNSPFVGRTILNYTLS